MSWRSSHSNHVGQTFWRIVTDDFNLYTYRILGLKVKIYIWVVFKYVDRWFSVYLFRKRCQDKSYSFLTFIGLTDSCRLSIHLTPCKIITLYNYSYLFHLFAVIHVVVPAYSVCGAVRFLGLCFRKYNILRQIYIEFCFDSKIFFSVSNRNSSLRSYLEDLTIITRERNRYTTDTLT